MTTALPKRSLIFVFIRLSNNIFPVAVFRSSGVILDDTEMTMSLISEAYTSLVFQRILIQTVRDVISYQENEVLLLGGVG